MNDQNKIPTSILEFQASPLHISFAFEEFSITLFQLYWLAQVANVLCVSTVPLPELDEILMPKRIILDAETWNLPTRKLQLVTAYGTINNFKKDIRLHFNCEIYFPVHVFNTWKLVKCHHAAFHQGMHSLLR